MGVTQFYGYAIIKQLQVYVYAFFMQRSRVRSPYRPPYKNTPEIAVLKAFQGFIYSSETFKKLVKKGQNWTKKVKHGGQDGGQKFWLHFFYLSKNFKIIYVIISDIAKRRSIDRLNAYEGISMGVDIML